MAEAPDSILSDPVYLLRRMVALSATFRTAVDADDETEALGFIHGSEAEQAQSDKTYAVVAPATSTWSLGGGGEQNHLRANGGLLLYLQKPVPTGLLPDNVAKRFDALIEAGNFFGKVLNEVAALAGQDQTADETITGSHLAITQITADWDINDVDTRESMGQFYWCLAKIEWGDG